MKRINGKRGELIIRYLSESMYKKIVKRRPVKIMVGGQFIEIRSRNEKELKKIQALQDEIKRLKGKIK